MECRRTVDGQAGATTSEGGRATGTGQCWSRGPSPQTVCFTTLHREAVSFNLPNSDAGRPGADATAVAARTQTAATMRGTASPNLRSRAPVAAPTNSDAIDPTRREERELLNLA